MKISKLYRQFISGLMCILMLSGFTGKEKYIELEGAANGRSSANFKRTKNVMTTLPRGTQGEILTAKKLKSGNYGIKIKVLNGANAGRTMWVYHRSTGDSTLALYKKMPSRWSDSSERTRSSQEVPESQTEEAQIRTKDPTRAVATLTIRETLSKVDNSSSQNENAEAYSYENSTDSETISAINEANSRLRDNRNSDEDCVNCTIASSGSRSLLRSGSRDMDRACNSFMNSQGQIGPNGQEIYNVLNSPKNRSAYTKRNALGSFCPNFKNLSDSDKLIAWTWFWTALAQEESNCDIDVIHATHSRGRVINPRVGYGLWAMEKSSNIRRHRGPECSDISTVRGQASCAIEIMKDTQLNDGHSASSDGGSYWGPVRRSNSQILPHMQRLTLCF